MRITPGVVGLAIGTLFVLISGCKSTGTNSSSISGSGTGSSFSSSSSTGSSSGASRGVDVIALTISPDSPVIGNGMTQQLTAMATYADGTMTNVTSQVGWSSADTKIATVSDTGLLTGTGLGSTTLSAQLSNSSIIGSVAVTVSHGNLVSISAGDPTNSGVMPSVVTPGDSYELVVTGTYEDGTTVDLTATATWSISNPSDMDIIVNSTEDVDTGTTTTTASLVVSQSAVVGDRVILNLSAPAGISGQISASCTVIISNTKATGTTTTAPGWNLTSNKTS